MLLDDELPHSGGSESGSGSGSDSATEGGGGVLVPHFLHTHMTLSDNGLTDVPFVFHAATVTQLTLSNNRLAALGVEMCSCGHRHAPLSPLAHTTLGPKSPESSADSDVSSDASATALTAALLSLSKRVRFAEGVRLKYFDSRDHLHAPGDHSGGAHCDSDEDAVADADAEAEAEAALPADSPLAPYVCAECTCRALPTPLSQLVNLRVLDVSGNGLRALGPEIGLLRALQTLLLGNNELDDCSLRVPEADWARLTRLTELVRGFECE